MHHLIVGGCAQGKLSYALSLYGLDPSSVSRDGPIINRLHEQVRQLLKEGKDPLREIIQQVAGRSLVVICDEVGCGLVPTDRFERQWRETVGRVCCELAKTAQLVDRVHCGIPTRLKGGQSCLKLR